MSHPRANPDEERSNDGESEEPRLESADPLLPEEEDLVESEPEDADGPVISAAENGHLSHP